MPADGRHFEIEETMANLTSSSSSSSSSQPSVHPWLLYAIILLLSGYAAIDFLSYHSRSSNPPLPLSTHHSPFLPDSCHTLQGHMPDPAHNLDENPWRQMKWIGRAASCPVNGHLIEKLDPDLNFRRGFALRFTGDVEDKTQILPWLLATRVDLNAPKRRVYLDLGANAFSTSITWFLRMYPCDFTEIHAFEIDTKLLIVPSEGFDESSNYASPNVWSMALASTPGVPSWMLKRIHVYNKLVSDVDDEDNQAVNITRFIKQELGLSPLDTVVVKMDIEGMEWNILRNWMQDPEMPTIIDELFVEVHYNHSSMHGYNWAHFAPAEREDALRLLAELRWRGFYAHPWP